MPKGSHCQWHLKFTQYHENWTVQDWKRVMWTDEAKVNRIGWDGNVYVWKQQREIVSDQTTTHTNSQAEGKNLMVWGCMGWKGVGEAHRGAGKDGCQAILWEFGGRGGEELWNIGDGWGWALVPAGQWSKTHLRKGRSVIFWQYHHSPEVACVGLSCGVNKEK